MMEGGCSLWWWCRILSHISPCHPAIMVPGVLTQMPSNVISPVDNSSICSGASTPLLE